MINSLAYWKKLPFNQWIPINSIPGEIFWSTWERIEKDSVHLSTDWQDFKKVKYYKNYSYDVPNLSGK
jgi:hypothetical protein